MMQTYSVNSIITPMDIVGRYTGTAPVDLEGMARALGIRLDMSSSMRDPDTSGLIRRDIDGVYCIEINGNDSEKRKKFTLAHEIAHYILHRELIDQAAVVDDGMYRSGLSTEVERQANRMAADLLMPREVFHDLWRRGVRSIAQLSSIFNASDAAVRIRLRQLGYAA